jgi:hypothetical protein
MLEAILKAFRSPPDEELAAAKLESMRARIINVAKYKSNHTAFILDHYLLKEFDEAGGNREELYDILLPVYEQAYKDQLKVAEEFRDISEGIYFDMVMNYANAYASEAKRLKLKLNNKAMASST